jgi:transcription antitermination factor NusG
MAAACAREGTAAMPLHAFETFDEWFAAQVWSGREQLAADHLLSRGYEVFLPRYREYRRWSDRVKTTERALFPGYLFVHMGRDVLGKVLTAPGVVRIVGDGQRPLAIHTAEIDAVKRIVESGLNAEPWPFARVGDHVRIAVGPLRDTEGVVIRVKNSHRLVVSISLLQRSVAVELDAQWLTAGIGVSASAAYAVAAGMSQ